MAIENKRIFHINAASSTFQNTQMGIEAANDSDLGFQMWAGKDNLGAVTKWLAKGKPAWVDTLRIEGLAGAIGILRHDNVGDIAGGLMTVAEFNTYLSDGPIGGVSSLNSLVGNLAITAGPAAAPGILITPSDPNIQVQVKDAPASEIDYLAINGSTYKDSQSYFDFFQAPTRLNLASGQITDGGSGTVNVAAGDGIIKSANAINAPTRYCTWAAATGLTLVDDAVNYIGVQYHATTPYVFATTSQAAIQGKDKLPLGLVKREGTDADIVNFGVGGADLIAAIGLKAVVQNNSKPEYGTGIIIGDAGTRHVSLTAGTWFFSLHPSPSDAFDSSVADTWDSYYTTDGGTTWVPTTGVTQVDNQNYNGPSGLSALGTNQYGVMWFYRDYSGDHLYSQYGTASHGTVSAALDEAEPSMHPWQITQWGILVGITVVQKSGTELSEVVSVFIDNLAGGTAVNNHNLLSGLQGGTAAEYYHMTAAQHTDAITNMPFSNTAILWANANGEIDHAPSVLYYNEVANEFGVNISATDSDILLRAAGDGDSNVDITATTTAPSGVGEINLLAEGGAFGGGNIYIDAGTLIDFKNDGITQIRYGDGYVLAFDDVELRFGTSNDANMVWDTSQTNHALELGLSSTHNFIICQFSDIGTIDHAVSSHPTLSIYAANATNYLSIYHDSTTARIENKQGAAGDSLMALFTESSGAYNAEISIKASDAAGSAEYNVQGEHTFSVDDEPIMVIDKLTAVEETKVYVPDNTTSARAWYFINEQSGGASYIDLLATATGAGDGATILVKAEPGSGGVGTITIDSIDAHYVVNTKHNYYIDDTLLLTIDKLIDAADATVVALPNGTSNRALYIKNQQANGEALINISSIATTINDDANMSLIVQGATGSTGTLALDSSGGIGDITLKAVGTSGGRIYMEDQAMSGSTYTIPCRLADSPADWTLFVTNCGSVERSIIGGINLAFASGGVSEPAGQVVYGTGSGVDSETGLYWDTTNDLLKITSDVVKTNWYDAGAYSLHLTGTATQGNVIFGDDDLTMGVYSAAAATELNILSTAYSDTDDARINIIAHSSYGGESGAQGEIEMQAITYNQDAYISMEAYQTDGAISAFFALKVVSDVPHITTDVDYIDLNGAQLRDLQHATYGSSFTNAVFSSGTITANYSTGKAHQDVTITAAATALTLVAPPGASSGLTLKVTASGANYTLGGFTGVTWFGGYDLSDSTAMTIPNGSSAIITLRYESSAWDGSAILQVS